jgi:PHD/YefM family antitoxin component YafN of YafNO toxin-antitoxin module
MAQSNSTEVDMVTIPRHVYETLLETIEVLSDKAEIESFKRGIEDIRAGRTATEKEFLARHKGLVTK